MSNFREIVVDYRNYKKVGTGTLEAEGNLIIIDGENRAGKTSIITGILENLQAKSLSSEPLARGTDKGFKQIVVPDKDGNKITVNHTFGGSGKPKFYAVHEDGKRVNSVTAIRELIGDIPPYSVDDVFRLNATPSGRREIIRELFLPLLTLEDQQKIADINKKINTKDGTVYIQRRELGKEIEILKASKKNAEESVDAYLKLNPDVDRVKFDVHLESLKKESESVSNKRTQLQIDESNNGKTISLLQDCVLLAKGHETFKEKVPREEYDSRLERWFAASIEAEAYFNETIKKVSERNFSKEINECTTQVKDATEKYNQASLVYSHITSLANTDAQINEKVIAYDEAEKELEIQKNLKSDIFSKSDLPNGLEILSETEYKFNGFDLASTDISESEGWLLVLKLMMPIYSGKVMFAGNIGIYGKKALEEINKLAESYGKVCLVERVVDDQEEVGMVAYFHEDDESSDLSENFEKKRAEARKQMDKEKEEKQKKKDTPKEEPFKPNIIEKETPKSKESEEHANVNVNKDIQMGDPFSDKGPQETSSDESKDLFGQDNSKSLF